MLFHLKYRQFNSHNKTNTIGPAFHANNHILIYGCIENNPKWRAISNGEKFQMSNLDPFIEPIVITTRIGLFTMECAIYIRQDEL